MNYSFYAVTSFGFVLSLFGAQAAYAAMPAGEVTQLSGFVMALKANGALKVLSAQSVVEVGDTLVSEENTYVRIGLADGRQAVLGPQTRLELTSASRLTLATGQLQVLAANQPNPSSLTIAAGETTVDSSSASFSLFYRPDPATALARRAYAQASLALIASPVQSDAGSALPLWQPVAQIRPPQPASPISSPGLYVKVTDGQINISNPAGSKNLSAGQFGYTASINQPPVLLSTNPGVPFSVPPSFSSFSSVPGGGTSVSKTISVDCVVR